MSLGFQKIYVLIKMEIESLMIRRILIYIQWNIMILKNLIVVLLEMTNFRSKKKISVFKPTLNHVIKTVENYIKEKKYKTVNYNIEIKSSDKTDLIFHPDVKEFSDLVVNVIKNKKILERTTVQSFDFRVLKYINKNYPEIGLSILTI